MSARREKRLRALERRVEALETIAATPVFIHTQGDGKEDYVLEAVWSKETADTYPDTTACPHFKPRTWTRPPSCHDCDRKHGEMRDGSVLCSGWPFYKKEGDAPCQNGKMAYGKNLSLF